MLHRSFRSCYAILFLMLIFIPPKLNVFSVLPSFLSGLWCAQDKQTFWSPPTDNVQNFDTVEFMTSTPSAENNLRSSSGVTDSGLASSLELNPQELPSIPKATSSTDVSTCYRLRGVVNHLGHNAFGGHFLTDILDPEGNRWLRCDDSLVTDVSSWN